MASALSLVLFPEGTFRVKQHSQYPRDRLDDCLGRIHPFRWVDIQGRRLIPSSCSKCVSKAKAFFSLRDLMTEKLVQSV